MSTLAALGGDLNTELLRTQGPLRCRAGRGVGCPGTPGTANDYLEPEQAAHAVSGYLLDPGPAPDLSSYDISEPADAGMVSVRPPMGTYRAYPPSAAQGSRGIQPCDEGPELDRPDRRAGPGTCATRTNAAIAENLRGLAAIMRPMADEQQLLSQLDSAAPDDVTIVERRRRWETSRRAAGHNGYHYPAHVIGRRGRVLTTSRWIRHQRRVSEHL